MPKHAVLADEHETSHTYLQNIDVTVKANLLFAHTSPHSSADASASWHMHGAPEREEYGEPAGHVGRVGVGVDAQHDVPVKNMAHA